MAHFNSIVRMTAVGLAAAVLTTVGLADGQDLAPRHPLSVTQPLVRPAQAHQLIVKFRDDVLVRAGADGRLASRAGGDLSAIDAIAADHGASFSPLIQLPEERLINLQERAAARSGVAQPDLAGMMIVHAPDAQLQRVAERLSSSALVEFVHFQDLIPPPPCEDIAPLTPQYFPDLQIYHGPDPGVNMQAAWAMGDARGTGIVLADCEYGYYDHEDLCDIIMEPGQTIDPGVYSYGWDEHGTAVFGEMIGLDNEYGVTGLAPDASGLFFPEWTVEEGFRRVTAITNAIAAVDMGDVVLLEMQTGAGAPAETDPAVWTVVRAGTDAGVVVVGAAGNGNQNLDSAAYNEYRSWGDSGAIIVGAGSPDTNHDKLSYSTYGERVNVQGWGYEVFTLGYGDYARHGNDDRQQYTSRFSGTSSASPFVAGCCLALQSLSVEANGYRLDSIELRDVLMATGLPQGSGGQIGPFPNMEAAAEFIGAGTGLTLTPPDPPIAGQEQDFLVSNGSDGQRVGLVYSLRTGSTDWPACPGVSLGLDSPKVATTGIVQSDGTVVLTAFVPGSARGRTTYLQLAEQGTCRISTVVEVVWE